MKQVCFVIWVCAAAAAMAAEVVPRLTVDGKTYHDVRWGPVNDGKVVIFHSRGNAVVPLGSLPAEYQALLTRSGMPSARAVGTNAAVGASSEPLPRSMVGAASESQKGDWGEYNRERKSKLVLNNRLVDRSELMSLVGFVGNPVRIYTDTVKVSGVLFELAEKRGDVTQPAEQLALRPGLWQRTGQVVLLRNYKVETEIGVLVRVYVAPAEDVEMYKSYYVATEPSFEQWLQLRRAVATPTME